MNFPQLYIYVYLYISFIFQGEQSFCSIFFGIGASIRIGQEIMLNGNLLFLLSKKSIFLLNF